jgi:diaminopimelate decarboxylase
MSSLKIFNYNLHRLVNEYKTPLYIYSYKKLIQNINDLKSSLPQNTQIHYAIKANDNLKILNILSSQKIGADIVSAGELYKALKAKIPPQKIIFSGVGKTDEEIEYAIKNKIEFFNIESVEEALSINKFAKKYKIKQKALLRINPKINPNTHPYIATGLKTSKFGLSSEELNLLLSKIHIFKNLNFLGLSCHIGSQITNLDAFKKAWFVLKNLASEMPFEVSHIDLGGGLGIDYNEKQKTKFYEYGNLIQSIFKDSNLNLHIELGRSIIANTGFFLSKVIRVKERKNKQIIVLDAGFNDFIRPMLYHAKHKIITTSKNKNFIQTDLVGPICESSDVFYKNIKLPKLKSGDFVIFTCTGAYGMSMSSQYNSRPRPAECLIINSKKSILIREREKFSQLIQNDVL